MGAVGAGSRAVQWTQTTGRACEDGYLSAPGARHQRAPAAHRCAQTAGGLVLALVVGGGIGFAVTETL